MWLVNARVLARPDGRDEWLPGTVRYVEGVRHYVILDSGDDGWFDRGQLRSPEQGRILISESGSAWRIGDRVFARWNGDLLWYPGTILGQRDGGYHVLFDDQDQAVVRSADLMELAVNEGDAVLCRPKFEPELRYFPAEVKRVAGEMIDVEYDDLDLIERNTHVGRLRLRNTPDGPTAWEEGDRVFVSGRDGYWYPARVLVVDGDRLFVHFYDNRHCWMRPSETKPLRLHVGQTIEVRRNAEAEYAAADIKLLQGDVLRVRYADRCEETTLIRLIRTPQSPNGS